jgi:hypothetical protein
MFNDIQNEFDKNIKNIAQSNLLKRLNSQGINRAAISNEKFDELLDMEIEILKNDGKKVGAGIAVGIGISLLTGGLL